MMDNVNAVAATYSDNFNKGSPQINMLTGWIKLFLCSSVYYSVSHAIERISCMLHKQQHEIRNIRREYILNVNLCKFLSPHEWGIAIYACTT